MQLSKLKTEIQSLNKQTSDKSLKGTTTDKPHTSTKNYSNFEAWHLVKVNNNAEFNIIEKGNKKFYWCDNHQYPGADVKGMYVFHKPTEHDA
jgi:hypothetical protein